MHSDETYPKTKEEPRYYVKFNTTKKKKTFRLYKRGGQWVNLMELN